MRPATVEILAEKLLFAPSNEKKRRNNIIVIGAGVSVTAGIPIVPEIAKKLVKMVSERLNGVSNGGKSHFDLYVELEKSGKIENCIKNGIDKVVNENDVDWWGVYDECFKRYMTQPNDVRKLFSDLVDEAGGAINWSHLVLGDLVARGIFSTVLTTNFDQLALSGIVRAGIIPVVCDGLESLNRIDGAPNHPQLIEIHGSRHTYFLRNDRSDVAAVQNDPAAIAAIQNLFSRAHCVVVVGYGGREDGLMDLLIKSSEIYTDKNIFWIMHDADFRNIPGKAERFLSNSRNSHVILGQDSDVFFLELSKHLRAGSPSAIATPLDVVDNWIQDAQRAVISNADIKAELDLAAFKLGNLRRYDDQSGLDPALSIAASIRARRIAGDLPGSFKLAKKELRKYRNISQCPIIILREIANVYLEFSPSDVDIKPSEIAAELSIYLAQVSENDMQRAQWYKNIGKAITEIGNRDGGHSSIGLALPVLQQGLEEVSKIEQAEAWAHIKLTIANSLGRIFEISRSSKDEADAISAYDEVIEFSKDSKALEAVFSWAVSGKAIVYLERGIDSKDLGVVDEGIALFKSSLAGLGSQYDRNRNDRTRIAALIYNLAAAFFDRYSLSSDIYDLEICIKYAIEASGMYVDLDSVRHIKISSDFLESMLSLQRDIKGNSND